MDACAKWECLGVLGRQRSPPDNKLSEPRIRHLFRSQLSDGQRRKNREPGARACRLSEYDRSFLDHDDVLSNQYRPLDPYSASHSSKFPAIDCRMWFQNLVRLWWKR